LKDGLIYSHPNKTLDKHLFTTLKIAEQIAQDSGRKLDVSEKKAIILHDIAKAHPAFQKRLLTGQGKFGHSEPSAAMVLCLTADLLCAEAVHQHHSRLRNIKTEVWKFWNNWEWDDKRKRLFKNISWWPEADNIADYLQLKMNSWFELLPDEEEWEQILTEVVDSIAFDSNEDLSREWVKQCSFYSILVTADRLEAAIGQAPIPEKPQANYARVQAYLREKQDNQLAWWREEIRNTVINYSRKVFLNKPGIYTLTLPTGAGKTIIGLQVASEFAVRNNSCRIIYVLPYVSLVEQNADIARIFFDNVREDHHLAYGDADSNTEEGKKDNHQLEEFISFFRYWQEPVIVTTLAKLWEVMYSPRANDAMSFHSLYNSVVILDEPQSIPVDCWLGFGKTMEIMTEKLNTTFILMTATQPEIAQGIELAPEPVRFPAIRHSFYWLGDKLSIENLAGFMIEQGAAVSSSLFVLNTRKSALIMWSELLKYGLTPFFLSRWMTPIDRANTLDKVNCLEKNNQWRCLVSTQVIEAGIDLDFELVFRDLGPLDSIIQVAGRCNRHGSKQMGRVFIAELASHGKSFAAQVYDSVLLQQTRLIFKDNDQFDESLTPSLIESYYKAIHGLINDSPLWNNIEGGCWGDYVSLFKNNYDQDEAMVIIDYYGDIDKKIELLQESINPNEDKFEVLKRRRQLFLEMSSSSISVPKKYLNEWSDKLSGMILDDEPQILEQVGDGLWIIKQAGIGRIYRTDIGFVPLEMEDRLNGNIECTKI